MTEMKNLIKETIKGRKRKQRWTQGYAHTALSNLVLGYHIQNSRILTLPRKFLWPS